MKTAEEIGTEIANRYHDNTNSTWDDHKLLAKIATRIIEQSNLDAFKAGEMFATDKCPERRPPTSDDIIRGQDYNIALDDYTRAILTDANNRTELP